MRLATWALCGAAFLSVSFGASMAAQGTRAQDPDVLGALLTEVRGLRQAMEQMASAGPRVQLALGRLQLQEQRVNTMLRRLETVREQLGGAERALAQHQTQVAGVEGGLKSPELQAHPDREAIVRQMTQELKELHRGGILATTEVQRFQTEVATLEQQIATEQGRWSEINRAREDLERALGKRGGV
jgi:chromosome segregation ATPase